jgi:hypothetical protein
MINSVLGTPEGELSTDSKEEVVPTVPAEPRHFPSIIDSNAQLGRANSEAPHQPYPPQPTPLLLQYQLQPSLLTSAIDPALIDSQNQAGLYLPNPYQTYTPPDQTYTQSYERYNSRTSSPGNLAQQSSTARVRIIPKRQLRHDLQFDILQNKPSLFPSLADDIASEDDGLGTESNLYERPSKRPRYNDPDRRDSSAIGPTDMPPPHMMSYNYGYSAYPLNQQPIPPIIPVNAPMTPAASSTHSDESYKFFPNKLSPYRAQDSPDLRRLSSDSDPRRLSVESLLSGPPGMPDEQSRKPSDTMNSITSDPRTPLRSSLETGDYLLDEQNRKPSDTMNSITSDPRTPLRSSFGTGEYVEEMTTWGVDRGFCDLDVGKNDDLNAITGASPVTKRAHLNLSHKGDSDNGPIEFGFGVQAKDTVFEKSDYYAK